MDISDLDFWPEEQKNFFCRYIRDSHKEFLERIKMTEEEYNEFCKPYLSECNAFIDVIKTQKNRKKELENTLRQNVARTEYSAGGQSTHRGFYCPSLIQDIVIGNSKRGRLCKADDPKVVYTHYFDINNRHIAVEWGGGGSIGYISYDENKNKTLSVQFCGDELSTISECKYDACGKISSYIHLLCDSFHDRVDQYDKELYTYTENKLIVEFSSLFICSPMAPLFSLSKYVFTVENGYLKEYTVEVFDMEDLSSDPLEDRTHKVKIKRKI